jgi:serine/threonine protein kinase
MKKAVKREDRPKWEACYHMGLAETDRQVSLGFNHRKPLISRIRYEENDDLEFEYDVFECTEKFEMQVGNLKKQYSGTIVIVMEKEKHDLHDYLVEKFNYQPVPPSDLKRIMHDTLKLVYFLHVQVGYEKINNRVVHRDIKFKNILVPEDYDDFTCQCQTAAFNKKSCCDRRHKPCHHGDCKKPNLMFTDFGFATYENNSEGKSIMSTGLGTAGFVPPEIANRLEGAKRYEAPVDLWSVGIMFYEMMMGDIGKNIKHGDRVHRDIEKQMESVDGVKVFTKFDDTTENQIRTGYGDSALDLITKLLDTPGTRMTSTAALDHNYFKLNREIECEFLREKSNKRKTIEPETSSPKVKKLNSCSLSLM